MAITVKVEMPGLAKLRKALLENAKLSRDVAQAWETVYRSYTRQRFYKLSRGGGEWPALKPITLKRRRKGGQGAAILRDTGALFAALQPSLGGNGIFKSSPIKPIGFRAFLSGGKTYKSGPTLTQVAEYHHHGAGRLPKRTILAQPDRETLKRMADHAKRLMVAAAKNR